MNLPPETQQKLKEWQKLKDWPIIRKVLLTRCRTEEFRRKFLKPKARNDQPPTPPPDGESALK